MATKVLHGEGKPRIIIQEDTRLVDETIDHIDGYKIFLTGAPTLTIDCINRLFTGINAYTQYTSGKVTAIDADNFAITVESFSNGFPAAGGIARVSGIIIDLPYCQALAEAFEIDSLPAKKRYFSGKKVIKIRGFYYQAVLDYSRYAAKELLMSMQNVYTINRPDEFIFIPRRDNPDIQYLVQLNPEAMLEMQQLAFHEGHRNVRFEFIGTARIDAPPLLQHLGNRFGEGTIIMTDDIIV